MSVRPWLGCALVVLSWPGVAAAQNCSVSMNGNIQFGYVNQPGQSFSSVTGSIGAWCSGAATAYVRVCISLGAPVDSSWNPRLMYGPNGQKMAYNIYSDPGFTQIWGSDVSPVGAPVALDVKIENWGGGSGNVPYYARVPRQDNLPTGHYYVNFTAADTQVYLYGHNGTAPVCSSSMVNAGGFNFGVTADVQTECTVSATTLDFGSAGNIATTAVMASSTITVNCTPGINYSVALNAGQGSGATMAQRRLTRTGGTETLRYGLYRDNARTQLWGDGSAGSSTAAGTGNGNYTSLTVYGTLPVQTVPPPGQYSDTVTVTLTY